MNQEKNSPGKLVGEESLQVEHSAKRILNILGLSDTLLNAAKAAVELEAKQTNLSTNGIVERIVTAANFADRRGVPRKEFLEDFLAQTAARKILENLNLPINNNFIFRIAAVVKAEAKDTAFELAEAANCIMQAASEDRRKGIKIDIFYFEDVKWRSNAKVSKAEQRKLDNLAASERAREILRQRRS